MRQWQKQFTFRKCSPTFGMFSENGNYRQPVVYFRRAFTVLSIGRKVIRVVSGFVQGGIKVKGCQFSLLQPSPVMEYVFPFCS